MKHKGPVLAVDGGATSTLALVADPARNIITTGKGKSSNFQTVGKEKAFTSIKKALIDARATKIQSFSSAVFAIAGIDTPADFKVVSRLIKNIIDKLSISVEYVIIGNDAEITMLGELGENPGILVLSGTGSIVYGFNGKDTVRVGGWGHRLADEGSAFYIGHLGLVAAFRSIDGRGRSILYDKMLKKTGTFNESELKNWVYSKKRTVADIAALAPIVIEAAIQQDKIAKEILRKATKELVISAKTVHKKLSIKEDFTAVVKGGMFHHSDVFLRTFCDCFYKAFPKATVVRSKYQPVVAALKLAIKKSKYDITIEDMKLPEQLLI